MLYRSSVQRLTCLRRLGQSTHGHYEAATKSKRAPRDAVKFYPTSRKITPLPQPTTIALSCYRLNGRNAGYLSSYMSIQTNTAVRATYRV